LKTEVTGRNTTEAVEILAMAVAMQNRLAIIATLLNSAVADPEYSKVHLHLDIIFILRPHAELV
jgi:hypothetical protein